MSILSFSAFLDATRHDGKQFQHTTTGADTAPVAVMAVPDMNVHHMALSEFFESSDEPTQ